MDILVAKVIVILLFFLSALCSTFVPVYISGKRKATPSGGKTRGQKILEWCNSVAGGVFLATCFVALLPFVRNSYMKAIQKVGGLDDHYPYGEVTILVGFFLVVFIEVGITYHNADSSSLPSSSEDNPETSALMSGSDQSLQAENHTNHQHHHSHSHHHGGHSHNTISSSRSLLHSIILVITLGVHTLFEGVAIGLLTDIDLLITLVIAVFIHEVCCSVALGVNISQQSVSKKAALVICCVFSCMMPAGIAIGIGLGEVQGFSGLVLTAVMQGLATGTFMYVLFMEIVPSIFDSGNSMIQILLMFFGCIFMSLVIIFTHSHEHGGTKVVINSTMSAMP